MLTALLIAQVLHVCPSDLSQWKKLLGAEWIDRHAVADLTTTNNPYTDPQSLTGMGFPPPGAGASATPSPATSSSPITRSRRAGRTSPKDKGNMGANFYRAGTDETATSGTPWVPGAAIHEWTFRMRQATAAARALLSAVGPQYGVAGVTFSYAAGISNGGHQTRRAIETDFKHQRLYDGGMDWEGTLFLPTLPPGIRTQTAATGYNLFTTLPTALLNYPRDTLGVPLSVAALAAVGFNPQSEPLWSYHWGIYWGLTQKVYRLEFDRYYAVQGGNHVDPQYDDHAGVDAYGDTVLRPILPCARAAIDALAAWVERGTVPPPSHTIARPQEATPARLANQCSLQ